MSKEEIKKIKCEICSKTIRGLSHIVGGDDEWLLVCAKCKKTHQPPVMKECPECNGTGEVKE